MKTPMVHLAKSTLAILAVSNAACSDPTPPGIVAIELVPNDNVKRAGADMILTYFAREAAALLGK